MSAARTSPIAFSFRFTLEDYEYLNPDLVLLYSGYNDLSRNQVVFRRESAIFRRTIDSSRSAT